ncbi:MAG: TIGR03618 family F420-dependent PPOX class oxidoreductase [Chloroflexi bacterium]|nr:TIGR03618 family F420-dependent PPOX class oxidoreductase [Chloroflexota bacterium]
MADLTQLRELFRADGGFTVVSTTRSDGSIQSSVVTAGVMDHPASGTPVLAFVARGGSVKLANLRKRPRASAVVRAGRNWLAVEGQVELAGPDDNTQWLTVDGVPRLLREVFVAAGGRHDNWEEYDRVMAQERRTAVLITIERLYGVVR